MAEPQPRRIVFGVDTLQSVRPPKQPSKAQQDRIARNATHPSQVDTSRPTTRTHAEPVNFPEPKAIPQRYELQPGTIKYSGWFGSSYTTEIGIVETQTLIDELGVRRPKKGDKGPAPSWHVKETFPLGEDSNPDYYVTRVGTRWIGQPKKTE